jgi:hypothetical protein
MASAGQPSIGWPLYLCSKRPLSWESLQIRVPTTGPKNVTSCENMVTAGEITFILGRAPDSV